MSWDDSVEMTGEFPVFWGVLKNLEGLVDVWTSPYQQFPHAPGEERKGLTTYLIKPVSCYTDAELSAAALHMCELVLDDWLRAKLVNPIYRGLREQREREGGYQPA